MKAGWKGVVTVATAALLGLAALPAPAAEGAQGRRLMRGPHGPGGDRMADFVGLTEEQKAQWDQMRQEFHESMRATFEQQRANGEKLREALDADQPDPAAVGRMLISMHQQRKQFERQHEALEQRLRGALTPEQQTKFDAFQAARPKGPMGRHGFGPMFVPGPGGPEGPEDEDGAPPPFTRRLLRPQGPGSF